MLAQMTKKWLMRKIRTKKTKMKMRKSRMKIQTAQSTQNL